MVPSVSFALASCASLRNKAIVLSDIQPTRKMIVANNISQNYFNLYFVIKRTKFHGNKIKMIKTCISQYFYGCIFFLQLSQGSLATPSRPPEGRNPHFVKHFFFSSFVDSPIGALKTNITD